MYFFKLYKFGLTNLHSKGFYKFAYMEGFDKFVYRKGFNKFAYREGFNKFAYREGFNKFAYWEGFDKLPPKLKYFVLRHCSVFSNDPPYKDENARFTMVRS